MAVGGGGDVCARGEGGRGFEPGGETGGCANVGCCWSWSSCSGELVWRVGDGGCGSVRGVPSGGGGADSSRFFRRAIVSQRLRRKLIGHVACGHLFLLLDVLPSWCFWRGRHRGVAGQTKVWQLVRGDKIHGGGPTAAVGLHSPSSSHGLDDGFKRGTLPSRNEMDDATRPGQLNVSLKWCASSNMGMKRVEKLVVFEIGWHHSVEKPSPELPVGGRATRRWRSKPCRNEPTMQCIHRLCNALHEAVGECEDGHLARASDVILVSKNLQDVSALKLSRSRQRKHSIPRRFLPISKPQATSRLQVGSGQGP